MPRKPVPKAVDILRRAREILSKRGAWTRGRYAEDKDGSPVPVRSPEACRFCIAGAMRRAQHELGASDHQLDLADRRLTRASSLEFGEPSYIAVNDRPKTRKKHVLALLGKSLEGAK